MKKNKIKNRRRTLHVIYWLLLAVIVLVLISYFKLSADGVGVGVPIPGQGNKDHFTYSQYICAIYNWALNIGFGLTLLMFIYAGYRYMTAAGNDAVFTDTKDILTSAILGFLLLLLIKLILNILNVPAPDECFPKTAMNTIHILIT
ncbi:MAG: hypothetical protein M1324_02595 [Patescibacteria group bacterium]|nr:hypothetical protein [Patescibacteria group bacterium]